MDIITAKLGANMAQNELAENGQIGTFKPEKEIFESNLEAIPGSDVATMCALPANGDELEVGVTYTVTTDSGTFFATSQEINGFVVIGNSSLLGGADTGESFVVALTFEFGAWGLGVYDFNCGSHIKVSIPETITPIDPKYLPGAVLPVVELTTTFATGAVFTEAETALLNAAWETGMPAVIKCNATVGVATYDSTAFVWGRSGTASILIGFFFTLQGVLLEIISTDGGESWFCVVEQ